ncbi:MAG: hypothetical protein GY795_37300, partial [Desulfobacterales bacterium]|nr:hypothetical protein [Desulfobacterales bacterium]
NLKKALDLAQSDTTKYGTCLNLGRLYVYEAGKIYKDSRGRRKEEAVSKVNQANECFTRVYEDAGKKDDNGNAVKDANGNVVWDEPVYGAKAAYRLGVAALETALVRELEGDDKKKKFDEASEKFHEAADLFEKCAAEAKKNKFLSGREAEDFREKYGEEPIDLRSLAEMKYGRAVALLGALVFADEYVSEKEVKEHRKREVRQAYEDAFSQVPDSIDFLREAFRELNMLRVSLGKEENRARKAMDDSRKVIICTWLEKNRGIEEKYDEAAELNWGFPISKNVIEEFLADNNCDKILGKAG